jgi:hypothetical protein
MIGKKTFALRFVVRIETGAEARALRPLDDRRIAGPARDLIEQVPLSMPRHGSFSP